MRVQIHALIRGALNSKAGVLWKVDCRSYPPGEILVCGAVKNIVKISIVQRRDGFLQCMAQVVDLGAIETRPPVCNRRTYRGEETVTVESSRAMTHRQNVYLPGRLECNCRSEEQTCIHNDIP